MASTRLKPERLDASYRSMRIYWPTRWRLISAARADRRAGLPIGLSPETTPVLRGLVTKHDEVCERERTRLLADTESLEVRLAQLEAQLSAMQRSLVSRTTEAELASRSLSDDELSRRRAGEEGLPDTLVRQRRLAEHQKAVAAAEVARLDAQEILDRACEEQARLQEQRQQRLEIASSRALSYGDHTQRLAAIYRRALAKRHPQRERLADQWQSDICPPPPWAVLDALVPSSRATGVLA